MYFKRVLFGLAIIYSVALYAPAEVLHIDNLLLTAITKGCKSQSHAFDGVSRKCWPTGGQGPCGNRMIFQRESCPATLGLCSCAEESNPCRPPFARFDKPSRQCFEYFTQGLCKADEWLVPKFNTTNEIWEPECQPNVCLGQTLIADKKDQNSDRFAHPKFFFAHGDKCYTAGTQAFCIPDQVALFVGGTAVPGCYPKDDGDNPICEAKRLGGYTGAIVGGPSSCPDGYEEDSDGACTVVIT